MTGAGRPFIILVASSRPAGRRKWQRREKFLELLRISFLLEVFGATKLELAEVLVGFGILTCEIVEQLGTSLLVVCVLSNYDY